MSKYLTFGLLLAAIFFCASAVQLRSEHKTLSTKEDKFLSGLNKPSLKNAKTECKCSGPKCPCAQIVTSSKSSKSKFLSLKTKQPLVDLGRASQVLGAKNNIFLATTMSTYKAELEGQNTLQNQQDVYKALQNAGMDSYSLNGEVGESSLLNTALFIAGQQIDYNKVGTTLSADDFTRIANQILSKAALSQAQNIEELGEDLELPFTPRGNNRYLIALARKAI